MKSTNKHKANWKDYSVCLSVTIIFVSICGLAAYIPVFVSAPQDGFLAFILDRLKLIVPAAVLFSGITLILTIWGIVSHYGYKPVKFKSFWTFVPYTLTVFLMAGILYRNSLPIEKLFIPSYIRATSPDLTHHNVPWDLMWFLCAVANGYIFLPQYSAYRKSLFNVIGSELLNKSSYFNPQIIRENDLLEEAERLANTFSKSNRKESVNDDPATHQYEFYAFIYGEGFDYVIIDEGYAVPFLFEDEDTVDDLHGGIYVQINKTLYIRFDHIMLFDFEELYIVVSPSLEALFEKINKKSVKEKLYSYRYTDKGSGYYKIDSTLEAKLRSKFKME